MTQATTIGKVILILFISFAGMTVYESCCGIPDFPYYEITFAEASAKKTTLTAQDTLKLILTNQKFKYLADNQSLFTTAYAWTCDADGFMGPKYQYTELLITCDKYFDDAHPAGSALNDLFHLTSLDNNRMLLMDGMNRDSVIQRVMHGYYQLETAQKPALAGDFEFLIQFENTMKDRVIIKTPQITWQ